VQSVSIASVSIASVSIASVTIAGLISNMRRFGRRRE
jgi:uncharacterized membrane protein